MYQYEIRPVSGQQLAGRQSQQQKASQVNPNSLELPVFFLHSFLSTNKRIRNGALSLLAASLIAVLSGCGGMTYNNGSASGAALSKISCGTQSLTGAQSQACSVSLSAPAVSATTVTLTSSNAALTVPASVTVAAGATSAGFNAVSASVSQAVSVTITAKANGASATDVIALGPAQAATSADALSAVSCGTQSLTGAQSKDCTVSLSAPATSATTVSLTSSNAALTVPASVTVAAGATSASFSAKVAAVTTTATVTLTAAANGTSATDVLQLTGSSSQSSTQHQVDLSWDAPTATSDPVAGYHVYRATSNSTSYTLLTSSVDTQTSYTDTSVVSGTSYAYQVKSVDSKGVESAPSNTTSVTVP
jgi:Fibronectin type III domain